MTQSATDPGRRQHRRDRRFVLWGVVALLVVIVALAVAFQIDLRQRTEDAVVPDFASLTADPDPSLTGGIAFLDGKSEPCIRVRSASGAWRNEELQWCAPGRTLRWTSDGRLEHLAYSNDSAGGRPLEAAERVGGTPVSGQSIDLATGQVEPIAPSAMPPTTPEPGDPTIGPGGQVASVEVQDGHVRVTVTGAGGSRTVMDATGGSRYSVAVEGWAPDESWLLLSDTGPRYLIVTLGEEPRTWVLDSDAVGEPGTVAITGLEPWTSAD